MPNFAYNQFGGYAYNNQLRSAKEEASVRAQTADRPGRDGAYSAGTLLDSRRITLEGIMEANDLGGDYSDPASLRAVVDAFKAAHRPGPARPLFLADDRFLMCEIESSIIPGEWRGLPWLEWNLTLIARDNPYWQAQAVTTLALANGANIVTPTGTAFASPIFTFAVSTLGGTLTLSNTTRGEILTVTPSQVGSYVVDCAEETVTLAGTDKSGDMNGVFPMLSAGANSVSLALSGTLALSSRQVAFRDQWY